MKHRRGVDLVPDVSDAGQLIYTTLGMLPEFYVLGCRCRHAGTRRWWIDGRSLGSTVRVFTLAAWARA